MIEMQQENTNPLYQHGGICDQNKTPPVYEEILPPKNNMTNGNPRINNITNNLEQVPSRNTEGGTNLYEDMSGNDQNNAHVNEAFTSDNDRGETTA